jgi:hypothetical protein
VLATDFGHTWRSESCPGRLFRVEFVVSLNPTEPTVYTFMVDGIKFVDMPRKGMIGGGGRASTQSHSHYGNDRGGRYDSEPQPRTVNGFGGGAPSTGRSSGTSSGFGRTNSATSHSNNVNFGAATEPAPHKSRKFIYDDEGEDDHAGKSAAAAGGNARAHFQSPASNSSGFGFDPFSEAPAPGPPAKSAAANLFNAFDDAPQPAAKSSDPFGASDPFAAKGASASSAPNFFDDDFGGAAKAPANDFGAFPAASNTTPARRHSAMEISQDFAGLSFAASAAPKPSPAKQLFAAPEPEPEPEPAAAPESAPADAWAAGANLVNLDLSGTGPTKRPSATEKGPSLASMMHAPVTTHTGLTPGTGTGHGGNTGLHTGMSPGMGMGMGGVPTNSRASFASANPLDLFGASPAHGMGGPGHMGGPGPMAPQGAMGNTRSSFTAGPGAMPMGGMGAPMGSMGAVPMGGMGGMGGAPMGGMGGAPMGGMGNPRASFTAGPGAMPMGSAMGAGPMGGPMGANTRGSFISAQPPAGMGYGATPPPPPKNSLDALNWDM